MAHTVQAEWGLDGGLRRVPVYAQCGEARQLNVDKMVFCKVDWLPPRLRCATAWRCSARTAPCSSTTSGRGLATVSGPYVAIRLPPDTSF